MKFIKKCVPDKRWQTGERPIVVKGNPIFFGIWNLSKKIENLFKSIKLLLEKSFKEINDSKGTDGK